jgi:hypothetical protein
MGSKGFRKTNHRAVAGFLLPFLAAGSASLFVLYAEGGDFGSFRFRLLFLTTIPLILILGLVLSILSIPRIKDLGDKDYAFSGLVLNIFFILIYIVSLVYTLLFIPR